MRLTQLSLKQLNRLRAYAFSGIVIYMVSLIPLAYIIGKHWTFRVWIIGGGIILGSLVILYLILIAHYAIFRNK